MRIGWIFASLLLINAGWAEARSQFIDRAPVNIQEVQEQADQEISEEPVEPQKPTAEMTVEERLDQLERQLARIERIIDRYYTGDNLTRIERRLTDVEDELKRIQQDQRRSGSRR